MFIGSASNSNSIFQTGSDPSVREIECDPPDAWRETHSTPEMLFRIKAELDQVHRLEGWNITGPNEADSNGCRTTSIRPESATEKPNLVSIVPISGDLVGKVCSDESSSEVLQSVITSSEFSTNCTSADLGPGFLTLMG